MKFMLNFRQICQQIQRNESPTRQWSNMVKNKGIENDRKRREKGAFFIKNGQKTK
jgi:hypothetical protein